MAEVKETLYQYHGSTPVLLTLHFDNRGEVDVQVMKDMGIRACPEFFQAIGRLCGPRALTVQMKKPEVRQRNGNGNGAYNGKGH
jgi:DNA polymerase-3 subunit alpha